MKESFSETEEQILIGSLLGDGSLGVNSRNPRFTENHCLRQKEYLQWKSENLESLLHSFYYRKVSSNNKPHLGVGLRTQRDSRLLSYYEEFYQPKKVLSLKYLYKLKALGLAVWYQDDGNLKRGRISKICTQSFTLEEHHLLEKYFEKKWDISPTIHPRKRIDKKYYLHFPVKETRKLIDIIKPYIHPIMEYKIKIRPYVKN